MKKFLIVLGLFLAIPLLAEQRTKVMVWIPSAGADSLMADSINKRVRAVNDLVGQESNTNSAGTWLGYVTSDGELLQDTLILKVLAGGVFPNVLYTIELEGEI